MTTEQELTVAIKRASIAIEALMQIAAWGDEGGNYGLRTYGTYGSFDEPHAVQRARDALQQISPIVEQERVRA